MRGSESTSRWILAFDGDCGTCNAISTTVAATTDGRLEVLPLAHADVEGWRRQAMEGDLKWEPTLLHVLPSHVRAWTGPSMALVLARRLGPRRTLRVLRALGELGETARRRRSEAPVSVTGTSSAAASSVKALSRKGFLHLGGGVVAAASLTFAGQAPAFARSNSSRARKWVANNKHRLPRTYSEIGRLPIAYRKAVMQSLPTETQAGLWVEHVSSYKATHRLNSVQAGLVDESMDLIPRYFAARKELLPQVRQLGETARETFGVTEADALLGRLGPADAQPSALEWCECSTWWEVCILRGCKAGHNGCIIDVGNCGPLWQFDCDGMCTWWPAAAAS